VGHDRYHHVGGWLGKACYPQSQAVEGVAIERQGQPSAQSGQQGQGNGCTMDHNGDIDTVVQGFWLRQHAAGYD